MESEIHSHVHGVETVVEVVEVVVEVLVVEVIVVEVVVAGALDLRAKI